MRPIYLKMKAFGSYKDEYIDFSGVQQGIFLITGDTGAGKTTIFDAITFALYGASSGGKRDGKMMVSQYASPNEFTEVEFCFLYGEKQYTIRRSPEQPKYKVKKTEEGNVVYEEMKTTKAAEVELTLPDGKIFQGKVKETNEKIKEIMGIDEMQFTQIAMLAQGDFLKLLHARSDERKAIFAKIFDTYFYAAIGKELEERYKKVWKELEENQKVIETWLASITTIEGKEVGSFQEDREIEIKAALREIIEAFQCQLELKKKEIESTKNQLEQIQKQMHHAKTINQDFEALKKEQEQKEKLEAEKGAIELQKRKIQEGEKALYVQSSYEMYQNQKQVCIKREKDVQQWERQLHQCEQEIKQVEEQKKLILGRFETEYPKKVSEIATLENSLPLFEEMEKLQEALRKGIATYKQLDAQKQKQLEQEKKAREKKEQLLELMQVWMEDQVTALRQHLEEGAPCPVCGNIVHHLSSENTTEETSHYKTFDHGELQAAQKAWDVLHEKNQRLELELTEMQTTLRMQKASLEEKREKLSFESKAKAMEQLNGLQKQKEELEYEKQKIEAKYEQVQKAYVTAKSREDAERKNLEADRKECVQREENFQKELAKAQFPSEEAFLFAKMSEKQLSDARESITMYENAVQKNATSLELLKERTKDKKPIDVSIYQEEEKRITGTLQALETEEKNLFAQKKANEKAEQIVTDKYKERADLRETYQVLKALNDTANGKISRKRMDFQTYMQRRYFKQVIQAANERLLTMSHHQFILQCRELEHLGTTGNVGLDLDVYSIVNDQTRDVKSLSGGESFMAALSMALGLSDVIQNQAGKIRIDTMFIDEGFGSLSDETRNQALQLLNELSEGNRLIGIISHVTELKAQVETKLIVKKTENGSKTYWNQ